MLGSMRSRWAVWSFLIVLVCASLATTGPMMSSVSAQGAPKPPVEMQSGAPAEVATSNRWAILVAVQDYQALPPLRTPYFDAASLRRELLGRGYRPGCILTITDGTPPKDLLPDFQVGAKSSIELLEAVTAAVKKARDGGAQYLTFAYMGHGAVHDGVDYLLPAQVRPQFPARTGVAVQDIIDVVAGRPGAPRGGIEHLLLVLEMGRGNLAGPNVPPRQTKQLERRALKSLTALFGAGAGERSTEVLQPGRELNFTGGLFLQSFIQVMHAPDIKGWGDFEDRLAELMEVRSKVIGTRQKPRRASLPVEANRTYGGFLAPGPVARAAIQWSLAAQLTADGKALSIRLQPSLPQPNADVRVELELGAGMRLRVTLASGESGGFWQGEVPLPAGYSGPAIVTAVADGMTHRQQVIVGTDVVRIAWVSPDPSVKYEALPPVVCRLQGADTSRLRLELQLTREGDTAFRPHVLSQGLRVGSRLVIEDAVVPSGDVRLTLPIDLPSGRYRLQARIVPDEGAGDTRLEGEVARSFNYEPRVTNDQRWAILLAVQDYQDNRLPALKTPYLNASTFYQTLLKTGYKQEHIVVLTAGRPNAAPRMRVNHSDVRTRAEMIKSLYEAVSAAGAANAQCLTFAFFGHTVQADGRDFLLPADGAIDMIEDTGVELRRVVSIVDQQNKLGGSGKIANLLVVIDGPRTPSRPGMDAPGFLTSSSVETMTALYACDTGERWTELLAPAPADGLSFTGSIFIHTLTQLLERGGFKDWNELDDVLSQVVKMRSAMVGSKQSTMRFGSPPIAAKQSLNLFFHLPAFVNDERRQ